MEVMIKSCLADFILGCIFCMKNMWNGVNNKKIFMHDTKYKFHGNAELLCRTHF